MQEYYYAVSLVIHVICVMVAVGSVTVTDYLHLLGLRDPKLEKRTLFVFPYLSKLITGCLLLVYFSGLAMVLKKPELLESSLFLAKLFLVLIVTGNGIFLHKIVFPKIEHQIKHQKYDPHFLFLATFGGSLSIVSWYAIVVLAITKELNYSPFFFFAGYVIAFILAFVFGLYVERSRR